MPRPAKSRKSSTATSRGVFSLIFGEEPAQFKAVEHLLDHRPKRCRFLARFARLKGRARVVMLEDELERGGRSVTAALADALRDAAQSGHEAWVGKRVQGYAAKFDQRHRNQLAPVVRQYVMGYPPETRVPHLYLLFRVGDQASRDLLEEMAMNLPVGRDEAFCYLLMVMRKRGGPKVLVAMAKETENESERSYSGWRPEQKPVTVESAMPWFELALGFGEGVEKPRYSVTAYCLYCLAAKRTSDSIAMILRYIDHRPPPGDAPDEKLSKAEQAALYLGFVRANDAKLAPRLLELMESTQITAFGRAAGRHADHQLTHRLIAQWREADDAARDRIKSVIREIDPDMSVRPLLEAYEQGFEPAGDVLTELALTEAYCCVLAPYLRKSDRSRRLVILLLDTIGTAGCVKHLEYALYDCGEGIAWGPLIRCLQADGGGDAIDQLVEMYRNAGDGQAAKALYELGWLPDEQAQLEGLLCDAGAWDDIIDRRLGGEPITDAAYQRAVSVTSSGQRWRKALSDMAKHPSAEFAPCFLGVLAGYDGRHYDLTPQGPRNIQDDLNRRDELLGVAYAWLRGAVAALPVETLRTFAEVRVVSRYKTYARPDDDQGEDDLRPGTTQAGRQDHGGRFRELAKAELGRRGESAAE